MRNLSIFFCLLFLFPVHLLSRSNFAPRSKDSKHSYCGTYPGRIYDELRKARELRQLMEARRLHFALKESSEATQDIDNIAVIEDDGSIVSPANLFDLANLDLKLSPTGARSYTLTRQAGTINPNFGTKLPLTDDDFRQITFQGNFQFSYFGNSYSSVFINSDGNLTFTQGDAAHTARDLSRFNSGPPRIAVFFADLDPETSSQGGIFYNQLADRFLVTWNRIREFDSSQESTFQVALFPDGSFELTYGTVSASSGIVGWSGGGNLLTISLVDFSTVGASIQSGPVAESFQVQTEVDFTALAKKFYQTHGDDYDELAFFTNFDFNLGPGAFSYEINVKNDIQGIHVDQMDFSQEFGSNGKLQSYIVIHNLSQLPEDPDALVNRTYSTVKTVAHETAHRWLAYVHFKDGTADSTDLLGYQLAHWSFFFNADASVMEGNLIQDNGNGSFTIKAATNHYSKLDQYLMGLRSASEVEPLFLVTPASGTGHVATDVPDLSTIGFSFSGTRKNLTVEDIIAAEGPRIPDVLASPKVLREAFVLLVRQGTTASTDDINKLSQIQRRYQQFFVQASDGLGTVDTTLTIIPLVPIISEVSPSSGSTLGNTRVYISGNHFQSGATVTIGTANATDVQVVSASLITALTGPGSAGMADVVVTNPGAQPGTLTSAYTYRLLSPVTVSSNALRIPYIVDSIYVRSNLGINNPNEMAASVHISQLDGNGLLVNQLNSVLIPAKGFIQENSVLRTLEGTAAPSGREGSLVLESDQPIQAFVSQIDNQTGDPSILDGIRQGASRLILQSAANTGPFRSTLLVLNLSSSQALVNITALNRHTGQPIGTPLENVNIAGNGFVSFDNILAALLVNDSFGPVEIRSTNGAMLAVMSRVSGLGVNTSGFLVAQAADAGSQVEIIPFAIDTDTFRTNLGLNNLGTDTASVNITLTGANGNTLASTVSPIQVAPAGLVQINNVLRYLLNGSSSSSTVTQQQGYLKITANQPIKAFATQIDNISQDPSIESSVNSGGGNLLLKSSANTNFQSTLVVVNPNSSPTTVTLISRQGGATSNGTVTGMRTVNIPANGYFSTNNALEDIGATSSFGPIEIHSIPSLPIIAVSRVYSRGGDTSGFFNTLVLE